MSVLAAALDAVLALLVAAGSLFALIGSWGLARLPAFLMRLHAPTKVSTLGVGCVLLASLLAGLTVGAAPRQLLITLFVFVTAPIAAHVLAKAAIALDKRAGRDGAAPALESRADNDRKDDS